MTHGFANLKSTKELYFMVQRVDPNVMVICNYLVVAGCTYQDFSVLLMDNDDIKLPKYPTYLLVLQLQERSTAYYSAIIALQIINPA